MTYAAQLFDAVKDACSIKTDATLAGHLQVSKVTIHQWRHGKSPLPEARLNELLDLGHFDEATREYYTLGVMRDAVTTTGVMRALDNVLDRLRPALARVGIIVVASLVGIPALPSTASDHMGGLYSAQSIHYAKSRSLRTRLARWLARLLTGGRHDRVLALQS